jgi:rod shape determining protein RodA
MAVLGALGLLTLFGSAVLYSAAGGRLGPWALIHFIHFVVFPGWPSWSRACRVKG